MLGSQQPWQRLGSKQFDSTGKDTDTKHISQSSPSTSPLERANKRSSTFSHLAELSMSTWVPYVVRTLGHGNAEFLLGSGEGVFLTLNLLRNGRYLAGPPHIPHVAEEKDAKANVLTNYRVRVASFCTKHFIGFTTEDPYRSIMWQMPEMIKLMERTSRIYLPCLHWKFGAVGSPPRTDICHGESNGNRDGDSPQLTNANTPQNCARP